MSALSVWATAVEKHFPLGQDQAPKRAVDGASFSIGEGERVGFIGRNGAGKTTLLQMLAGVTTPTAGTLSVRGRVTAIFTLGLGLREDLTGLENIHVEGELLGRSREETQALVDSIVDFAELGPFIDRPVRTYSTGMKARLAFSTMVHVDPEILIIDEALSVGDSRFAAKATARMRELAARGRILILVSHSMQAVNEMCNRCIWVDEGRIRMDGPPEQVTAAYLDEVRRSDEAGALERFRREVVRQALQPGWDVEALECRGSEGLAKVVLTTGEPAVLAARVRGPAGAAFRAQLGIDRFDGLPILRSEFPGAAQSVVLPAEGARDLCIDMGRVPLNYGIYRVQLEVLGQHAIAARRSVLLEVRNPSLHRGGRPVLVYPTRMTVKPVPQ